MTTYWKRPPCGNRNVGLYITLILWPFGGWLCLGTRLLTALIVVRLKMPRANCLEVSMDRSCLCLADSDQGGGARKPHHDFCESLEQQHLGQCNLVFVVPSCFCDWKRSKSSQESTSAASDGFVPRAFARYDNLCLTFPTYATRFALSRHYRYMPKRVLPFTALPRF